MHEGECGRTMTHTGLYMHTSSLAHPLTRKPTHTHSFTHSPVSIAAPQPPLQQRTIAVVLRLPKMLFLRIHNGVGIRSNFQ